MHRSLDWDDANNQLLFINELVDASIVSAVEEEEDDDDDDGSNNRQPRQHHHRRQATRPLVHGMLVSSLFSTIFANISPGCVYMNQSLDFIQPIFVNQSIIAKLTITKIRTWPKRFNKGGVIVTCDTQILISQQTDDSSDNSNNDDDGHDQHQQQTSKVVKEGVVVAVRGKANVWLPGGYIK